MNILIFSWRGPGHPNAGGAEISTHEHAKGWVKAGHSVTLFSSYYQGAKGTEQIDGVTIIQKGRQFFGVQWEAFKWYNFASHSKFDLVIDQFHGIPFFTPLYVRGNKLAFIHEVTKEVWSLNPWPKPYNLFPAILGTFLEPLIFKFFYKKIPFMTVSDSTKKDLIDWGIPGSNISVVHNGLNMPKVNYNFPKEREKTLIFLGALSKDKGIEDGLKIFSLINNREKDWRFWVVGKGGAHYLDNLKFMVKILNLDKKVKFWGYVSDNKKFELLSRAHILVNPSIREGWGLVVIEAASVGTPAAAFDVPGLRDSIIDGRTGVLCKDNSTQNLAKEILDLLKNDKKFQVMCNNALLWSKRFSWDKASHESLKLLKDLLK